MIPFPALALAALIGRSELLVCAVAAEAQRRGVDPYIACAMVEHESQFNPRARSVTRDGGLYQIHEPVHGRWPALPSHIRKGTDILCRALARERGDYRRALSRYNAGRVCRRGLAYADAVLSRAAAARKALSRKVGTPWRGAGTLGQMDRVYGFAYEWAPRKDDHFRRAAFLVRFGIGRKG